MIAAQPGSVRGVYAHGLSRLQRGDPHAQQAQDMAGLTKIPSHAMIGP